MIPSAQRSLRASNGSPEQLFRGHVRDGTHDDAGRRHGLIACLGQPEVQDFDRAIGRHHHVGRLEVTVDDSGGVRARQPSPDLRRDVERLIGGQGPGPR
jgi:hypothetical protein